MKVIHRLQAALIDFFIFNLFLTLVSLPIMVAWGLPLSWLSPIGNLIFSPFLSLFLLTSTLSFFCELFGIPHELLNTLLEYITFAWHYLLNLAPHNSYIGCSRAAFYLLLLVCVFTLILLMLPYFRSAQKRLAALTLLFFFSLTILKAAQPARLHTTLHCIAKEIEVVRSGQETALIDHGAFSERANPTAWVQYHLIPDLIKTTGSLSIEYLIIPRPTIRALESAIALMQHASVKAMYYPTIEGELSGSHRGVFRKWYAVAKSLGIALHRVHRETMLCVGDTVLTLVPDTKMQYREVTFKRIAVFKKEQNL